MSTSEPIPTRPATRLASIDVYRGLVMLLMMAEVMEFCAVSAARPASGFWKFLCHQQSHSEWFGCSVHDLIQPSFTFLVGVVLPFSTARRLIDGESQFKRFLHAMWRALVLVLLGVFLRSIGQSQTYWTFEDTLTQIGLGYGVLYLLAQRSARAQLIALSAILIGYWLLFALHPLPGPKFDWQTAGVSPDWSYNFTGFAAHWNKNTNVAWAFDKWFLNLFPREHAFTNNEGGYCTLSFIPTLATMILGLFAGNLMRSKRIPADKIKWLIRNGTILIVVSLVLHWLGISPIVKRIWTPGWTLFSGGICMILLAGFYVVIDLRGYKKWAFPLTVIGMNSIAAYLMAHMFEGFISDNLATNFGDPAFNLFGAAYEPAIKGFAVLLILWLLLLWMHKRKIFLRI